MTLTFNQAAYSNLLIEVVPKVIETEQEYDRALAVAERLTFAKNRTPEEQAIHKLIVTLIEAYEAQNYPMENLYRMKFFNTSWKSVTPAKRT